MRNLNDVKKFVEETLKYLKDESIKKDLEKETIEHLICGFETTLKRLEEEIEEEEECPLPSQRRGIQRRHSDEFDEIDAMHHSNML